MQKHVLAIKKWNKEKTLHIVLIQEKEQELNVLFTTQTYLTKSHIFNDKICCIILSLVHTYQSHCLSQSHCTYTVYLYIYILTFVIGYCTCLQCTYSSLDLFIANSLYTYYTYYSITGYWSLNEYELKFTTMECSSFLPLFRSLGYFKLPIGMNVSMNSCSLWV